MWVTIAANQAKSLKNLPFPNYPWSPTCSKTRLWAAPGWNKSRQEFIHVGKRDGAVEKVTHYLVAQGWSHPFL
jgi:hypothetical protein